MAPKQDEFVVRESPSPGRVRHEGRDLTPPADWCFVPAGDPGLTRRLKTTQEYWVVVHQRKNRLEALGLWTEAAAVARIRTELAAERSDPAYQRKLAAGRKARERKEAEYEGEFREAVLKFLAFAPGWSALAEQLADAVTRHAVPVGSGTVARTERIPVERRAEAAVIAWMRHQTTAYDHMAIARIKGERREVRRQLAERSRLLLARYRAGAAVDTDRCPLARTLKETPPTAPAGPVPPEHPASASPRC